MRYRNVTLYKQMLSYHLIDLDEVIRLYERVPPHRKVVLLVLLLALKDKATELRFEFSETEAEGRGLRLFYEVDGQLHELVPPPRHVAEMIIREVKVVAGFYTIRRRLADFLRRRASKLNAQTQQASQSHFQMKAGNESVKISSTVYYFPTGDRVVLAIPNCSASLSQKAEEALKAPSDKRKS